MFDASENSIKELLEIKEKLELSIIQKKEMMKNIEEDIEFMRISIQKINGIVANQSFKTAEELLESASMLEMGKNPIPDNIDYSRKVFDAINTLVCTINFQKGELSVNFSDPKDKRLTFIEYITKFVPETLKPLKENESDMIIEVRRITTDNIEVVKEIIIKNITSFESIDAVERGIKKIIN